jgi:hypothetical protein
MSSIKILKDVTIYNSITAVDGVDVNNLTVRGSSSIPDVSTLKAASASWDGVYSTVQSSSGDWGGRSTLNSLSSVWNSTTNVVVAGSANWNTVFSTVQSNSSEWNSSDSYVSTASGRWESSYSTLTANSGHWTSVYTTVQQNSANPSVNTLTVAGSATLGGVVGIGTTAPSPDKALYVVGDVLVYGNLSANGSMTFTNTLFTTTSALSVVNMGSGPALVVSQEGDQAIAAFYDHAASGIALWVDGAASRPGYVGIKTSTPNRELTVIGDISATGKIYSSNTINKFVSAFGDGSSTTYTIAHNLGTDNVVPCVKDNTTKEVVYPSLVFTTSNSITVGFTNAPANSAYTITVVG